jgi:antirestriction protein
MSDTDDTTFRVWIGCYACYNDGRLIGKWYDASEAGEVTPEDIHGGPTSHEELNCFDIENAPKGHRNEMSPMEAQRLADVMEAVGDNADAFAAWCANTGADFNEDNVSDFEDHFHGEHGSFRDYADELAEETLRQYNITDENGGPNREPHFAWQYFDWEKHANELLNSDYFTEDAPDGGVFIFSN